MPTVQGLLANGEEPGLSSERDGSQNRFEQPDLLTRSHWLAVESGDGREVRTETAMWGGSHCNTLGKVTVSGAGRSRDCSLILWMGFA